MSFYRPAGAPESALRFKLFHLDSTIPLSDALPMLENMGFRVIERTTARNCVSRWQNGMDQ